MKEDTVQGLRQVTRALRHAADAIDQLIDNETLVGKEKRLPEWVVGLKNDTWPYAPTRPIDEREKK
jgi:hypothetical protein